MNQLESAREKIDKLDYEMMNLFQQRMECAKELAEYKKEYGLSVHDKNREARMLDKACKDLTNKEIESYYREFFDSVLNISKDFQQSIMRGIRVAYSGIEGSFANMCVSKAFPNAEAVSYKNFDLAYKAVENDECNFAVLPIENSYAGEVGQVLELMLKGSLYINNVYELSVSQCLLGLKGSIIDDIKTVVSHPQALEQCNEYIDKHEFKKNQSVNTAIAAKEVSEGTDKSVAAIASIESAKLYGLEVLDKNINMSNKNTTRFAVFSKNRNRIAEQEDKNTFILMFTTKDSVGSLAKVLSLISSYGYNMRVIRSRPVKDQNWHYYFYTEIEGRLQSTLGEEMLRSLAVVCEKFKFIGAYIPDVEL